MNWEYLKKCMGRMMAEARPIVMMQVAANSSMPTCVPAF